MYWHLDGVQIIYLVFGVFYLLKFLLVENLGFFFRMLVMSRCLDFALHVRLNS